jgi:1-acyl-sn-glycerol-3-phosphate acyltransferase
MPTPADVSSHRYGSFARMIGALFLRLFGWRVEGRFPSLPKAVLIAAPHTSNWDLPFMLACAYVLDLRPMWLGKQQLFRWPFGGLMRWLGGLPVESRSEPATSSARRWSGSRLCLAAPARTASGHPQHGAALEVGLLSHRQWRRRADRLHLPRLSKPGRRHRLYRHSIR